MGEPIAGRRLFDNSFWNFPCPIALIPSVLKWVNPSGVNDYSSVGTVARERVLGRQVGTEMGKKAESLLAGGSNFDD